MPVYSERNAQVVEQSVPIFIPTVFVGLGGSGKSVLMRLRKQFHDKFTGWGNRFDRFARFVFIDTDRGEFAPRNEKNVMFADVMPRESEVVESTITRQRFQTIFDKLERQAEADDLHWLKPSMRAVGPGAVEDGAGTHRQFGRLAFFENFAAIREKIKAQIEQVLAYATRNPGETATDRIEVVIVTSLAGGTGSGMFLDVAYLVRDLLSHPDYAALRIKHVTLIAFLPEMFRGSGEALMPRLRQNAYAALLELEHYGTPRTGDALFLGEEVYGGREGRHGFRATWPGHERFFRDRGWDTLFLVDNVNNLSQANPLRDDQVFQMTADYLFLDFGHSRFATEKRTARSNLVQYKDRWKATWVQRTPEAGDDALPGNDRSKVFVTQSGCIYSSFGLAEIFFDLDNLYQSAAYRLANRLVQLRWIGSSKDYSDETYQEWADSDLLNPARIEGEVEAPTSFHPKAIARRAVVGEELDWLAAWEADLESTEDLAEGEAADKLAEIVDRHRSGLAPNGGAARTIAQNVANWSGGPNALGEWRRRLQYLADGRLSRHGIEPARKLLDEYRKALLEVGEYLLESPPGNLGGSLLSRLAEAKTVPFPVRQVAVRIELGKARDAADAEVRKQYAHVAGRDAQPALASAVRFIGEQNRARRDGLTETLHEWMDGAGEQLAAIAARLDERFEVASKGRDLVDHRKQSLTVAWDKERYDSKINQALLIFEEVGRSPDRPEGRPASPDEPPFDFRWPKLEDLVLREFRRIVGDARDAQRVEANEPPADSIADLLRYWKKNRMSNQEYIGKIAQHLAEACEVVLRRARLQMADHDHGNVADLLRNVKTEPQRRQMIEQMVVAAVPYLPTAVRPGEQIQPAYHNLFGLSEGGQATSRENAEAITQLVESTASARQGNNIAGFGQRLEAEQSSALFVRMMAGFPLQDYTRLEDLYNAYKDPATNTRTNDECHIDYHQSWEDLPDVRAVGVETYAQIRDHIHYVLLNMMTGVISYPKDRGAFYVLIPDPYGAGEDYHRLGKRISRTIKHACDDRAIRNYLVDRWMAWSRDAGVKSWACLYESALRTLNESRREVAVDGGQRESVPFRNCYGGLLQMIGRRLSEVEGGQAWLDALRPRNRPGDDDGLDGGDGRAQRRPTGLDAALRRIHDGLKIYQLVPSKVGAIALAEADPVSPMA